MAEIERFATMTTLMAPYPPVPDARGEWVRYSDHQAALAAKDEEIERLKARSAEAREVIGNLRAEAGELSDRADNAQQALPAELEAMAAATEKRQELEANLESAEHALYAERIGREEAEVDRDAYLKRGGKELNRAEKAEAQLATLRAAAELAARAIEETGEQPYPDDPLWTPWSRWIDRTKDSPLALLDQAADALGIALDSLHKPDQHLTDRPTDEDAQPDALSVADQLQRPNVLTVAEARNLADAALGDEHDGAALDAVVKRIGDWADQQGESDA